MRLMPALAEQDWADFGAAIGEIQRTVGDHFAQAQGGRFTSEAVGAVLAWLEAKGIAGVGQTSWGPTGFAVIESQVRAHALLQEARERFQQRRPRARDRQRTQSRPSSRSAERSGPGRRTCPECRPSIQSCEMILWKNRIFCISSLPPRRRARSM